MNTTDIVQRLGAKRCGDNKWQARCPAHNDHTPSLSISEGSDGKVLLRCFAGCSVEAITDKLGIKVRDLFPLKPVGHYQPANAPEQTQAAEAKPAITPRPLGQILDTVEGFLRRYVVFPFQAQVSVIAAWVVHSWR